MMPLTTVCEALTVVSASVSTSVSAAFLKVASVTGEAAVRASTDAALERSALTPQSRVVAIVLAGLFILVILELIRRHKLRERYTALWLMTGALMIAVGIFPNLLGIPNELFGVRTPGLALFVVAFGALLAVVLHLTVAVSRQGEEITRLAQELAIERAQRQQHDVESPTRQQALSAEQSPGD